MPAGTCRRHRHLQRRPPDHAVGHAPARSALRRPPRPCRRRRFARFRHRLLAGARSAGALPDGEGQEHGRSRRGAPRLLAGRGGAGRGQSADDPRPRRARGTAADAGDPGHRRRHPADRHGRQVRRRLSARPAARSTCASSTASRTPSSPRSRRRHVPKRSTSSKLRPRSNRVIKFAISWPGWPASTSCPS